MNVDETGETGDTGDTAAAAGGATAATAHRSHNKHTPATHTHLPPRPGAILHISHSVYNTIYNIGTFDSIVNTAAHTYTHVAKKTKKTKIRTAQKGRGRFSASLP